MASMQHDFIHPRQLDDVKSIRAAIKSFTTHMKRMMLLMKDLGTTLEQVSHSFDALTSLSFSDEGVKQYVHHFSEEVMLMLEGTAFQNYNKLVHEEVLVPVEQLRGTLKDTERAAKTEKDAFDAYKKAKQCVDKQEKSYAKKNKPLDMSKSYPTHVQARDASLTKLQGRKNEFEEKFVGLVSEVEKVTATTLKRYLDLNAGYMTSVVDALTKTDPTVEEAVALYQEEQRQQRATTIRERCHAVDTELDTSYASLGYRLNGSQVAAAPSLAGSSPAKTSNPSNPATTVKPLEHNPDTAVKPVRASPASMAPSPTASADATLGKEKAPVPTTTTTAVQKGPPLAAVASRSYGPLQQQGKEAAVQRGAFTVTSTAQASPLKPHVGSASLAEPTHAENAANNTKQQLEAVQGHEEDEDEDFGSVSQVGTAGKAAPPPLYSFSRGPQSQVSSVRPSAGYVASQNANLTQDFLHKMESKSLTASEVCAARAPSP